MKDLFFNTMESLYGTIFQVSCTIVECRDRQGGAIIAKMKEEILEENTKKT